MRRPSILQYRRNYWVGGGGGGGCGGGGGGGGGSQLLNPFLIITGQFPVTIDTSLRVWLV